MPLGWVALSVTVEAALLPAGVLGVSRRPGWLLGGVAAAVGLAARARRRQADGALPGGPRPEVPADVPLWTIAWLTERSICVWLALALRVTGGMPYRGSRLARAAHWRRHLAVVHAAGDKGT